MDNINQRKLDRVISVGRTVWNVLTNDEQEKTVVYDGTYGFIENVCLLLRVDIIGFNENDMKYVHDGIFDTES